MAKKINTDAKTLDLIEEVKRQKKEIARAERPNWLTKCTFPWVEGSSQTVNFHQESNVANLVKIAAFLLERERSYMDASQRMGVEVPDFTWDNYSVKDWLEDIRMRINKIQISAKRKKLETLEARLNSLISPELKAQLELEAITSELNL